MDLKEIAAAIQATRQEFRDFFLRAQVEAGRQNRLDFESVATSGVDAEAFEQALDFARSNGWLPQLVQTIADSELHSGALTKILAEANPGNAALQAITNIAAGFPHPDVVRKGIEGGMRWTVRIVVDKADCGTGVLIGPNLVLTAYHVLERLFPAGQPDPNGAKRLEVEFDDWRVLHDDQLVSKTTTRVRAHQDWHVASSPAHQAELNNVLPNPLVALDGHWDYVVIRLSKTPGRERRWARLESVAIVPGNNSEISVFHHPGPQQPLAFGRSLIVSPDPQAAEVVPRCRFLHSVNTVPGSSGGPCFDRTFKLFGIHQGQWATANGAPVVNRGVPIERVLESIKKQVDPMPAPTPGDDPIWEVAPRSKGEAARPVVGCDEFVTTMWRAAMGNPRIVVIPYSESATGKTFRLDLVVSLLPAAGHLMLPVSPAMLSKPADDLARAICLASGAAPPAFAPVEAFASTRKTWLKDEIVPKLIAALEEARNGRTAWLLFRDMNKAVLGQDSLDLILALCEHVPFTDWVRVVLDGTKEDVPAQLDHLTVEVPAARPTADQISEHLVRALAANDLNEDRGFIDVIATKVKEELDSDAKKDASAAMSKLAAEVWKWAQLLRRKGGAN